MSDLQKTLPILPLRDMTFYPQAMFPLLIGRNKTIKAVEYSENNGNEILLVSQKNADKESLEVDDFYSYGVLANILQVMSLSDGTLKVLVEGVTRVVISDINDNNGYWESSYSVVKESSLDVDSASGKAIYSLLKESFDSYLSFNDQVSKDLFSSTDGSKHIGDIVDSFYAFAFRYRA